MAERPGHKIPGAGKSSFELIDSPRLFSELNLQKGSSFLDMGCGNGSYALTASQWIGDEGVIYAIDLWEEGIETLRKSVSDRGIKNIRAMAGDISRRTHIKNGSVDVCLLAAVLHDIKDADAALREISRVLKPGGTLAVMEFKKMDGPPGPPIHIRMTPEDVEKRVIPCGFRKERIIDIGPYNYLIMFSVRSR